MDNLRINERLEQLRAVDVRSVDKNELIDLNQVTIDETELNAELTSTKKDLETANKNNKTLEETIKSLKEKLKAYEENTVVSDGKKKVK